MVREARRSRGVSTQMFCGFLYKDRKFRGNRGFFPGKTCELLFIRGTTSFYNKKLQIFPVGEGVVWNSQM